MTNLLQKWLIWFANSDWQNIKGFFFYAHEKERIRRLVNGLSEQKVIENLGKFLAKTYVEGLPHYVTDKNPHFKFFRRVLTIITRTDINGIDVAEACLTVLLFLYGPFSESYRGNCETDDALFFFDGIENGLGSRWKDRVESERDKTELLTNVSWRIIDEPWTASYWESGKEEPGHIDFSESLLSPGTILVVSDRWGDRQAEITVQGNTLYDVLQCIQSFYVSAEAKYDETHENDGNHSDEENEELEEFGWCVADAYWFEGLAEHNGKYYVLKGS